MAAEKKILGHIDCPACSTPGGMRITADKNGDPFGFCEAECNAQLRIGGNARRVAAFLRRYPWAAEKTVTVTVTGTDAEIRDAKIPLNQLPEREQPKPQAKREKFAFGL